MFVRKSKYEDLKFRYKITKLNLEIFEILTGLSADISSKELIKAYDRKIIDNYMNGFRKGIEKGNEIGSDSTIDAFVKVGIMNKLTGEKFKRRLKQDREKNMSTVAEEAAKQNDDRQLKLKMWDALYVEEAKCEAEYAGGENNDNWFMIWRPWLQRGFEIALNVLMEENSRNYK